jgi:hypothetical protein
LQDARFVNRREKTVMSLFGPLRIRRPYYHGCDCDHGWAPWDEQLALGHRRMTRAAEEITALAGTMESFEESSETTLQRMAGLRVSESTVQRVTEEAGDRLAKLLEAGYAVSDEGPWKWRRDAHGRTCAYVSLDAVAVPQQGPGGVAAEWRMAWVGSVYNPKNESEMERPQWHQAAYVASMDDLSKTGLLLRRQATAAGFEQAEQQIAISDAGAGLENFFRERFPRAVVIVDFWHAREHLVELAAALFPCDDAKRQRWIAARSQQLRYEGGAAVLAELEKMEPSRFSAPARDAHAAHTQYFRNHAHKMEYPQYRANGWQIGSGPIEAACKTVVSKRMKQSGMRWGLSGANALCHLRALLRSGRQRWQTFWYSSSA